MHPLLTVALCASIGCTFIATMIGDLIAAGLFLGLVVVTACTARDARVSEVSVTMDKKNLASQRLAR